MDEEKESCWGVCRLGGYIELVEERTSCRDAGRTCKPGLSINFVAIAECVPTLFCGISGHVN